MKTLEALIKKSSTETLVETLATIFKDMSKMKLNVMIQEELENRIGEDKLDTIIDALR